MRSQAALLSPEERIHLAQLGQKVKNCFLLFESSSRRSDFCSWLQSGWGCFKGQLELTGVGIAVTLGTWSLRKPFPFLASLAGAWWHYLVWQPSPEWRPALGEVIAPSHPPRKWLALLNTFKKHIWVVCDSVYCYPNNYANLWYSVWHEPRHLGYFNKPWCKPNQRKFAGFVIKIITY